MKWVHSIVQSRHGKLSDTTWFIPYMHMQLVCTQSPVLVQYFLCPAVLWACPDPNRPLHVGWWLVYKRHVCSICSHRIRTRDGVRIQWPPPNLPPSRTQSFLLPTSSPLHPSMPLSHPHWLTWLGWLVQDCRHLWNHVGVPKNASAECGFTCSGKQLLYFGEEANWEGMSHPPLPIQSLHPIFWSSSHLVKVRRESRQENQWEEKQATSSPKTIATSNCNGRVGGKKVVRCHNRTLCSERYPSMGVDKTGLHHFHLLLFLPGQVEIEGSLPLNLSLHHLLLVCLAIFEQAETSRLQAVASSTPNILCPACLFACG